MKYGIVSSDQLGDDWTAEHHLDQRVGVRIIPAVRVVVTGIANYQAASAAAFIAAAGQLGTDSLNLVDQTTLIKGGTAYTYSVREV